jgi:hypothetical protein
MPVEAIFEATSAFAGTGAALENVLEYLQFPRAQLSVVKDAVERHADSRKVKGIAGFLAAETVVVHVPFAFCRWLHVCVDSSVLPIKRYIVRPGDGR